MLGTTATVFITLDPECPFCQLYAHDFQEFAAHYAEQGVRLVGIYAGLTWRPTKPRSSLRTGTSLSRR
jgi:thiol-disulfide isomerase/thioredoxin